MESVCFYHITLLYALCSSKWNDLVFPTRLTNFFTLVLLPEKALWSFPNEVFPSASFCLERNSSLCLTLCELLTYTCSNISSHIPVFGGDRVSYILAGREAGPGPDPSLAVGQQLGGAGMTGGRHRKGLEV